jgi:hypothetical protein
VHFREAHQEIAGGLLSFIEFAGVDEITRSVGCGSELVLIVCGCSETGQTSAFA